MLYSWKNYNVKDISILVIHCLSCAKFIESSKGNDAGNKLQLL